MTLLAPELVQEKFSTPRGHAASMLIRQGTSDHNTVYSCLTEDEYGLKSVDLGDGIAIDVGAHIGGVTVALARDNPQATVIAVEALSENVAVLERNVELNGLSNVTVIHSIAGKSGKAGRTGTVKWAFDGTESGMHHRFIGNAQRIPHDGAQSEKASVIALDNLTDGEIAFLKIDCEGCEYDVLTSPAIARVKEIRGEFHAGFAPIRTMLEDTHTVFLTSGTDDFGAFWAVRK